MWAAIAAVAVCVTGCDLLKAKVANLEEKVTYMKEEVVPLRFQIKEKSTDAMTVVVVLYDCQSGEKIGTSQKIKLEGSELHVDFQVIQLAEKSWLFFPVGLYTERMALKDSKKVFDMYDAGGFSKIYNGLLEMGEKVSLVEKPVLKQQLADYFTSVKENKSSSAEKQYGMAVHEIQSISGFKIGFTYKVLCHPHTGGIEIVKE